MRSLAAVRRAATAITLILLLIPAAGIRAQDDFPFEIPFTNDLGVGARAMGMAGAYAAVAEDATALYYNPAALARVERIELSAAFTHHRVTKSNLFINRRSEETVSPTRITQLGFVYPFPTYRGSFVIGFGFHRIMHVDRDYVRRASHPSIGGRVEEYIFDEGSLGMWTAGLAWDATPRVSLGVGASLIAGSTYRDYLYRFDGATLNDYIEDSDVTGITGSVGAQVLMGRNGRFALKVDLPKDLDIEANGVFMDEEGDELEFFDEQDMTLPFSATVGYAHRLGDLIVAADLKFTDWKQLDYFGPNRTPPPDRDYAYREVLTARFGAEYAFRFHPVRLRAGIARDPAPYRLILTEAADDGFEVAEFSPERYEVAVGLGALLEESFTMDVAYTTSWYDREGTGLIEETGERKLYVGTAFRF
ncbi:MAG: hypothetical protein GF355_12800 [Candidatus Eisenbacteria bacterium]|nr:hypothetical protein [Candidatus Eisenbacteria bacterium]